MKLLQPFLRRTSSLSSSLPGRPHQLRNASSLPRALLLAPGQQSLRNEYYALRHGWSKANEAGIIVSRIDSGARLEYGAPRDRVGSRRARRATRSKRLWENDPSPSSRPISAARSRPPRSSRPAVGADVEAEPALRERDFGDFELGPNTAYEAVWEQDAIDAKHTAWGVEAAEAVLSRAAGAVRASKARARATRSSSCRTATASRSSRRRSRAWTCPHRSLPHLETCELRRLELLGAWLRCCMLDFTWFRAACGHGTYGGWGRHIAGFQCQAAHWPGGVDTLGCLRAAGA